MSTVINLNDFLSSNSIIGNSFVIGFTTPAPGGEFKITLDDLISSFDNSTSWNNSILPDIDATKITTGTLSADRIPSLDASKIATGTLSSDRIPNLDASKITTGTLSSDRIPGLDATKIISGTLSSDRIPNLDASKITTGTLSSDRIPNLDSGKITSGVLHIDRIPSIPANKITGSLPAENIASIDAAKITSGVFNSARIPNLDASKITSGVLTSARIPQLESSKINNIQSDTRLRDGFVIKNENIIQTVGGTLNTNILNTADITATILKAPGFVANDTNLTYTNRNIILNNAAIYNYASETNPNNTTQINAEGKRYILTSLPVSGTYKNGDICYIV